MNKFLDCLTFVCEFFISIFNSKAYLKKSLMSEKSKQSVILEAVTIYVYIYIYIFQICINLTITVFSVN